MTRVLFICSRNKLRSPTAEIVFAGREDLEVASAGLDRTAGVPVDAELLRWAEMIFLMEETHRRKLRKRFREDLTSQRLICLGIPDDYDFMDPDLVELLRARVDPFLR